MEITDAVENGVDATHPGSTTKPPVPDTRNRSRSGKAKLSKLDEEMAKVRERLADMAAQRKEIANEEEAKKKERQEKMNMKVNRHLIILARAAGVDFRTPDGALNSMHNDLNEALIAGCFARIKMEVDTRPEFAAELEEEGKVVLAKRKENRMGGKKPVPESTPTS
jgi:hypothetical protein